MLKLLRYLKPHTFLLLLAIALLFVGVNADLALPDYMSKIVNVGIQQGGIDSPLPEAIRSARAEEIYLFMSDAQIETVKSAYVLHTAGDEKLIGKYPALSDEDVLVLDSSKKSNEGLEDAISKALMSSAGFIQQMAANPQPGMEDVNPYEMLRVMPPEQKEAVMRQIDEYIAVIDPNLLTQASIAVVKAEYEELGMNLSSLQTQYILKTGGLMLLISLVSIASSITVAFISARIGSSVSMKLRGDVFKKVEHFSHTEFDKFSTASLITRTTNDVTQVQMLIIMMIRMVFFAPIMGIGGVIRALGKSPKMSWIIAFTVALLLVIIIIVFMVAIPRFKKIQSLIDRLNLVIRENLSGMMVIRAFNTQNHEEKRFDVANRNFTSNNLFVNRVMVVMMPIMTLIMNGVMLTIVWVGAHEIETASMQVGDMMAFMQYAMQILMSFIMLSIMFIMIPRASVSATRISEVLSTQTTIAEPTNPIAFPSEVKGKVEFRGVTFRYPGADEDALTDITLTAEPGKTTAFIGSTGSGKSTLINLIPRFYDSTGGEILIDGVNIKDVTTHSLREQIGYIPQKGSLFSGTIRSNLLYGDNSASDEQLDRATKIAQAADFIAQMSDGIDTPIAQGGTNVSGGQKQRLSIARAIVKNAPIYIFDDSFSALDFKTDSMLRKALKQITGNSTILIVAQRISTIMNAEQICVLEEGKIVGLGTHESLMRDCETYREIATSQLSKEELA